MHFIEKAKRNSWCFALVFLLYPFAILAPKGTWQNFVFDILAYSGTIVFVSVFIASRIQQPLDNLNLNWLKISRTSAIIFVLFMSAVLSVQLIFRYNTLC